MVIVVGAELRQPQGLPGEGRAVVERADHFAQLVGGDPGFGAGRDHDACLVPSPEWHFDQRPRRGGGNPFRQAVVEQPVERGIERDLEKSGHA